MIPTMNVLNDAEVREIDQASRLLLQDVGIHVTHEEALAIYEKAGAVVDPDKGIVKIPGHVINDTLSKCSSSVRLYGRDGAPPLLLGRKRTYFGTVGIATNVLDPETGEYRPVLCHDLETIIRLADVLDPPHFILIPATPTDVPPNVVDLYEFKYLVTNTRKHFIAEAQSRENLEKIFAMAEEVSGGPDALKAQPFFSILVCLTSPLMLRPDASELLIGTARAGLPLFIESGPMSGATAPATLASTLICANAELLSSFVLAKAVNPAVPIVYASWARIMDMKTAGPSHGGPEFGLFRCATTQLAGYYNLPSGGGGILTDSKIVDVQLGMEKLGTTLLPALGGTNMISGMGLLAEENAISLETLAVDHEVCSYVRRVLEGIRVDEDTVDLSIFEQVGPGGHFIDKRHTLDHFRKEMWLPRIINRESLAIGKDPRTNSMENRAKGLVRISLEKFRPPALPKDIASKLDAIIGDE
jgi:trimethylamine--corrinoid protein Co-methyltransferase